MTFKKILAEALLISGIILIVPTLIILSKNYIDRAQPVLLLGLAFLGLGIVLYYLEVRKPGEINI